MGSYLMLWVVVGAGALVLDLITSAFLFVWFTIGSIAAIITMALGYNINVQVIVFICVSGILTTFGYPFIKRTIKKTVPKTPRMEENYIGREITLDEDVVESATIKFDGIYWTVKNEGEPVKKGDRVSITGIQGNKMIIKKN